MKFNFFSRNSEKCSHGGVYRGIPHVVDLKTMRQVDVKSLGNCNLNKSLKNCNYIGAGVVIYFNDPDSITFGDGCELRDYSVLEVGGQLKIGSGSVVGAYNWLQASGSVQIGDDVLIGPHAAVVSTEHSKPKKSIEFAKEPLIKGTVVIEKNVWIGAHVSVLMNVKIGANTTIGAGSLVTRSIPQDSIAYGSPCQRVGSS